MVKKKYHTIHIIEKSIKSHIIEWSATFLTVLGSIMNANLLGIESFDTFYYSFYLFSISNILWIFFALKHRHWGVFTTFAILGIVNVLAIVKNLV